MLGSLSIDIFTICDSYNEHLKLGISDRVHNPIWADANPITIALPASFSHPTGRGSLASVRMLATMR